MKRIALICLVIALILIPILGVNCDSNGNKNANGNTDTNAPRISSITISDITGTTVTISWTTDESATSNIEYGPTTSYGFSYSSPSDTSADKTSHSLILSGLSASTTYHFRVKSTDASGTEAISGDKTFITTSLFVDNTPPAISNVTVSNFTDTGAIITWTTNKATTSQIEYGANSGYGSSTILDTNLVNTHSITLTGLIANTDYHYRVKSTDASGNEAISGDYNFTTSPISTPMAILSGQPTGTVDYNTADIIVAGTGIVSYKYKLDRDTWSDETPVSTQIILSNLDNNQHTISIIGKDSAGNWQAEVSPTTASWTVNTATLPTKVVFPDANLEATIRLAIGKSQGDIYQADLVGLTILSTTMQTGSITDLTGLEHCTSLTSLLLGNNQISDISPLSSLTSLTVLILQGNQISDISPLASLTNLTSLSLLGNQISDISPLSSLSNLTVLGLENNQISDIKPLVNNPGLGQGDSIYLTNNPLSTPSVNTYIPVLKARGVTINN